MAADPTANPDAAPADPLAEVRRHRRQLDLARRALESGCDARSEHSQVSVHAAGAGRVLEAAVRRAAADPGVDPAALREASGLSRTQLARLAPAAAARG
jgi:hypothetical protein